MTLQLTPSVYGGNYNISCFGSSNGSIDLTVSGGSSPYSFHWSNNAGTEDLSNLVAGFYSVTVTDNLQNTATSQITLSEPREMYLDIMVVEYPNGFNISCHDCYNGMIYVDVVDGVPPYNYEWSDGWTQQDHLGLSSGNYSVEVIDQNGCKQGSTQYYLTSPSRDDWTLTGNNVTDAATHFIGTTNSQPLVLKSNEIERLRLGVDGSLRVSGMMDNDTGLLMSNADGVIFKANLQNELLNETSWLTNGNTFSSANPSKIRYLGTKSDHPLLFITNNSLKMYLDQAGCLGIGMQPPQAGSYKLYVEGGIAAREVMVKIGDYPDFVFDPAYPLMPLPDLREYISRHAHLPGIPSLMEVTEKQGIELGKLQLSLLQKIEELTLYILGQQKQIEELRRLVENKDK